MNRIWQIPKPHSIDEVLCEDGTIVYLRRHGNPDGRRLLLCHGNSLAIDLYYPFWSLLAAEFDLFLYDLRSHGWNSVCEKSNHNILLFVSDFDRILHTINEVHDAKPLVGVFHSMSAMVAVLFHASDFIASSFTRKSANLDAMILFDPPFYRPGESHDEHDEAMELTADKRRKAGNSYDSLDQFTELLKWSQGFSRLVPGARELMAETTLRESKQGTGYELRCPRDYEVKIIESCRAFAGEVDIGTLPCKTKVIGSDPLLPFTYLPTVDFSDMLSVDYDFIPESTHFLQIEKPYECAEYVQEFVREAF